MKILAYTNSPKSAAWIFYKKRFLNFKNKNIKFIFIEKSNIVFVKNINIILLFGFNLNYDQIKIMYPNIKIGLLDPRFNKRYKPCSFDFLVTQGIESSLFFANYNKPIFNYPIFPKMDLSKVTTLKQNKKIIIGYHGNKVHLNAMKNRITDALLKLNQHFDIELWLMYDKKGLGKYDDNNLPNLKVKHIQYSENNYYKYISHVDIGIIPQLIPVKKNPLLMRFLGTFFSSFNEKSEDFLLRFKETTNNGRAFIFAQFKIPIVADITPSSCALIGDDECGFIAYSSESWFHALYLLCNSPTLRNNLGRKLWLRYIKNYSEEILNENFAIFLNKSI